MPATDYERIERALHFLDAHARRQPGLDEVARHVGLSPHHLQRLFSRWAGVSPKRFVQFQTAARARRLLAERRSVLEVAYDTGLSGAGRLHDLMVSVDAVTPGEYKAGGAGLLLRWGAHSTPFGRCVLALAPRGICSLAFLDGARDDDRALAWLRDAWPAARLVHDRRDTAALVERIFGTRHVPSGEPVGLMLKGTNFQLKVWEALLRIPEGGVATYQDLAQAVGQPTAVRAVASAVARNPVAWLIPCHRVIRKTGAFGEYRWGEARKRAMLAWEAARGEPRVAS